MIFVYRFHGLAPSMAAASYSSPGTVCSPASATYVVNGTETKMATKIIAGNAVDGLARKSMRSSMRLRSSRNWLTTPKNGCSIQRNERAVINTEAAHGNSRA